MDAEYARAYRQLYEHHWWWRARESLLLETLREMVDDGVSQRLLDIGCGSGLFFDCLAEFGHVEGVEMNPELAAAEPRFRDRIHVGDFREVQPNGLFNVILMLDVLEHMPEPESVVRHTLALLEEDGRILVTVPAFPSLWTHHDVLNEHVMRYTQESLRSLAESAGARVERLHYFFSWTAPVKLLVRAVESVWGPGSPASVPRGPVNWMLYTLSRAEQRLFRRVRLPFGSSLLAILSRSAD